MTSRVLSSLALAAFVLAPATVAAQQLTGPMARQIKKGPVLAIELDAEGHFREGSTFGEIDAPPELVWATLTDFEKYPSYMPRVEEAEVTRHKGYIDVEFELDTPLVSTEYVNRVRLDSKRRIMRTEIVEGDNKGTRYLWQVFSLDGGKRTRLMYRGALKNFSSVVDALDDETQTVRIGVNTALLFAGMKAITGEAERRSKARFTRVRGGPGGSRRAAPSTR